MVDIMESLNDIHTFGFIIDGYYIQQFFFIEID